MTIEHYGELIKSWMTQRGLSEKDLAAKLGITETGVRNRLKSAKIKPDTLAKYADALGVQIVDKREFVLLPAETENALLDEALTKREYTDEEIENWAWVNELEERPIPRAPTAEEIEAARQQCAVESANGVGRDHDEALD